jgi:hypothetical protein
MECWIDGSWATGAYATNRWFRISAGATEGFVHASWVIDQATVGHCDAPAPAPASAGRGGAALRWATDHLGATVPSGEEAALIGDADGMWSGWCAGFTYAAYAFTGSAPRFAGNAADRFHTYERAGLVKAWTGGDVPDGAMLFWPTVTDYGHTALDAGGGQVLTTVGYFDPNAAISQVPVEKYGTPAGWVDPKDV